MYWGVTNPRGIWLNGFLPLAFLPLTSRKKLSQISCCL